MRQNYLHALGSVILIQAFSCGWIAQRYLIVLRQRAVLQIDRDYAARVVQRFFSMVKEEVDRVFREEKKRRKAKRKPKKRRDELEESLLEKVWKSTMAIDRPSWIGSGPRASRPWAIAIFGLPSTLPGRTTIVSGQ
jgi:hypothetical protein